MRTSIRSAALVATLTVTLVAPAAVTATAANPIYPIPPSNGQFDYQIGGSYKPVAGVAIVDRDRTAKPVPGLFNICYINAFQTQRAEDGWWKKHHPSLLLHNAKGKLVEDKGWPGEILFDTSTGHKRKALAKIENGWIDRCNAKGFDGIEPDNLDSNTRSHGLLSRADDFGFAQLLINHAHSVGIAIAQKNSAEQSKQGRAMGFDFAIAEECQVYKECGQYTKYYGDEVFEIEYTDNGKKAYAKSCAARGSRISIILRDRNVTRRGSKHYHYEVC